MDAHIHRLIYTALSAMPTPGDPAKARALHLLQGVALRRLMEKAPTEAGAKRQKEWIPVHPIYPFADARRAAPTSAM